MTLSNYSYFPVLINTKDFGAGRDELYARLRSENILARKYFYPLLSQVPEYSKLPSASLNNLTVAAKCAGEILCLPIYAELGLDDVDRICGIIKVKI